MLKSLGDDSQVIIGGIHSAARQVLDVWILMAALFPPVHSCYTAHPRSGACYTARWQSIADPVDPNKM
jgi:hypothetical protein